MTEETGEVFRFATSTAKLKNITITVEMIGPDDVRKIFSDTDFKNRKVKSRAVSRYAEDMRTGHWKLTPEPIVIDDKGNLFQGQHRLLAVIEANCVVPFLVIRGWSNDVFDVLDSGIKRTVADVLTIDSEHSSNNTIAAASRLLGAIKRAPNQPEINLTTHAHRITKAEILDTARERYDDLIYADAWMQRLRSNNVLPGIGPSATTASIAVLLKDNDREIVGEFLIDLMEGKFAKGDPRLALSRWKPTIGKNGIATNLQCIAVFIKAWNAVWEDRQVSTLRYKATETFPEVVPAMRKEK